LRSNATRSRRSSAGKSASWPRCVPIYEGEVVGSRTREAIARRSAAQQSFLGVVNGLAQIRVSMRVQN
jgi:hypothetical protein